MHIMQFMIHGYNQIQFRREGWKKTAVLLNAVANAVDVNLIRFLFTTPVILIVLVGERI